MAPFSCDLVCNFSYTDVPIWRKVYAEVSDPQQVGPRTFPYYVHFCIYSGLKAHSIMLLKHRLSYSFVLILSLRNSAMHDTLCPVEQPMYKGSSNLITPDQSSSSSLQDHEKPPQSYGVATRTETEKDRLELEWNAPSNATNPQNWPFWVKVYHTVVPAMMIFAM